MALTYFKKEKDRGSSCINISKENVCRRKEKNKNTEKEVVGWLDVIKSDI